MKITEEKYIFIINTLKVIISEFKFDNLIKKLPKEFFFTLFGLSEINEIKTDNFTDLQLLIMYIRLMSGLDIFLITKDERFYFVNITDKYESSTEHFQRDGKYYEFKIFYVQKLLDRIEHNFENSIEQPSDYVEKILNELSAPVIKRKSKITNFVILTHNRPLSLEKCLNEFIENFKIFGHEGIKIIISDDSEPEYLEKNREIVEKIKLKYSDLIYIDFEERNKIINSFIAKNLSENTEFSKISESLNYILGEKDSFSSAGKNRNFVSLYLKKHNFITVDDDARPKVLSYSGFELKKALEKLPYITSISKLKFNDDAETIFIPVDFIGYFNNSDLSLLQFVKYSGCEDGDLSSYIINHLNLKNIPGILKDKYSDNNHKSIFENRQREPKLQGLCIYFPANFKFNLTLPEKVRVEDMYIGFNFFLEKKVFPVSSQIALFHEKDKKVSDISAKEFHLDIMSMLFFTIYKNIIFKHINEELESALNKMYKYVLFGILIEETLWNNYKKESLIIIKNLASMLKYCQENPKEQYNLILGNLLNELSKEIFSNNIDTYRLNLQEYMTASFKKYFYASIIFNKNKA